MDNKVTVLLASHNGELFIKRQVESILSQDYQNIEIIISDDGSTDKTFEILRELTANNSNIKVIVNPAGGSARSNFNHLIRYAIDNCKTRYYMFSDQDDYWFNRKVSLEINCLKKTEEYESVDKPIMVYTNYYIKDSVKGTREIAYAEPFVSTKFSRLVMQSWPMGCTMLINRALLEKAGECPSEVPNHDEWISQVASLLGEIMYIHQPTMEHILHSNNATTRSNHTALNKRILRVVQQMKNRKKYFYDKLKLVEDLLLLCKNDNLAIRQINKYRALLLSSGYRTAVIMKNDDFHCINMIQDLLLFIQLAL